MPSLSTIFAVAASILLLPQQAFGAAIPNALEARTYCYPQLLPSPPADATCDVSGTFQTHVHPMASYAVTLETCAEFCEDPANEGCVSISWHSRIGNVNTGHCKLYMESVSELPIIESANPRESRQFYDISCFQQCGSTTAPATTPAE